jgi:hypothetical protein
MDGNTSATALVEQATPFCVHKQHLISRQEGVWSEASSLDMVACCMSYDEDTESTLQSSGLSAVSSRRGLQQHKPVGHHVME